MITATIEGEPAPDWPPLPEREQGPLHQALLAALGPLRGLRLLDVGCGVGLFLCAAVRRGALVAGTDTAVERLEIARWALPDADLRVMAPHDALPFDNGTFDVVTARGGADHTELARVTRPGGLVAVGGWVGSSHCWAATFAGHLRRLAPPAGTGGGPEAAGLTVHTSGTVLCTTTFPSVGAAWTAMLGSEDVLRTIRLVGETPVRHAFARSVAGAVTQTGTVRLPKTFRYTVATVGVPTSWATFHQLDNESGSVTDRPGGRD